MYYRQDFSYKGSALILDLDDRPAQILRPKEVSELVSQDKVKVLKTYCDTKQYVAVAKVTSTSDQYLSTLKPCFFFRKDYVWYRDDFTCQYCGEKRLIRPTVDHVLPRILGGRSTYQNCVTSCYSCNRKKGGQMLEDSGLKLIREINNNKVKYFYQASKMPFEWFPYLEKSINA